MKKVLKTPNAPKSVGIYNQAIESNNFIFTSGQVGIDPSSNKLVEGGLENEINQVLKNIDLILKDSNLEKIFLNYSTKEVDKIDFVLNKLNTFELVSVIVTVIVSALPESSDTNIDFTIAVVAVGTVYSVVSDVVVKSTFLFTNELAKEKSLRL